VEPSRLALLFSHNNGALIEGRLAPVSSPHRRRRYAGTHALDADLLHPYQLEPVLTGHMGKDKIRPDFVPLNDRIPDHDHASNFLVLEAARLQSLEVERCGFQEF
jgi:hypothetical protein